MADQVRELHLLVPDVAGSHVLVTAGGALPARTITLADDETTVAGASRELRGALGLDVPVLEIHFDYALAHDDVGAVPVPVLVVAEPPAPDWSPPDGLAWRPVTGADPEVAPGLRLRLGELLAERRGELPLASLRPRWARTGWHARATGWMFDHLDRLGRPPTGPIEQVRQWGISALMRAPTAQGTVWFKAVFPVFGHEPAITALLDRTQPGSVAPVLAHDDAQGWLLLDDIGSTFVAGHPDADPAAIEAMVAIQRRFADDTAAVAATGAPRRPFTTLADRLAPALRDPDTRPWVDVEPARVDALVVAVRRAAATIDTLGFPQTLVHGDFHPGNVALRDGRPVIFDWSDAAIAHPIVDAMTWASWLERREPDRAEAAWRTFVDAWSDVCAPDVAEAARPALRIAAAAYHAVSYHGIVTHLEQLRRPELGDGLQDYVHRLDQAVAG